ncbi:Biotin synthase [Candidatus Rubidus massiliensis]|nr:Biotin synthase [Candidatus Rubidus massiliensis]
MALRYDWSLEDLQALYDLPLLKLLSKSNGIHNQFHKIEEIQVCKLISIKTGGCPEDCKYCAQSSFYQTNVSAQPLMSYQDVLFEAKKAINEGATRVCLGAAWRKVRDNKQFEEILSMIQAISKLGVEVCCTLGMVNESQAIRLKEAGLYAYNHNLDTSEDFYKNIITTRTYDDRLNTLNVVEKADIKVCCGGILGLGESTADRLKLLLTLAKRNPHPESVPINRLSSVPGTPLENQPPVPIWEFIKIIAIARIIMPKAVLRLSSGRIEMSIEQQALCFLAGANSIFAGEKLLTVANTSLDTDKQMFSILELKKLPAFV